MYCTFQNGNQKSFREQGNPLSIFVVFFPQLVVPVLITTNVHVCTSMGICTQIHTRSNGRKNNTDSCMERQTDFADTDIYIHRICTCTIILSEIITY